MVTAANEALQEAVLKEAHTGLTASPKTLSPWLFYDERGSQLFERITQLPEYYLTRTERGILSEHADDIFLAIPSAVTIAELGAGTATKTGILLEAATRFQHRVLYQPIDVSPTALDEAAQSLRRALPDVTVRSMVANYITEPFELQRPADHRILTLYIGSSIGNFSPAEAKGILVNLREHLQPGDFLLLGVDLAPSEHKSVAALLAAYDDAQGVTAAFNMNVLERLNRDLAANFRTDCFGHVARWNAEASRMEMHLKSLVDQTVRVHGERIEFAAGETIHTENSHKFTEKSIAALLASAGFADRQVWQDRDHRFAVTLAEVV